MKKIILLLMFTLILSGCKKEVVVSEEGIDLTKTVEYQHFYEQERKPVASTDQVAYGKSSDDHTIKYYLDENNHIRMSDIHYKNGKMDQKDYYIPNDHSMIYLEYNEQMIGTELTKTIQNELTLLTKKEIQEALDQGVNIRVIKNATGVPYGYVDVTFDSEIYSLKDNSFYNQEYENTYTYHIALDSSYTGFLSILSFHEVEIEEPLKKLETGYQKISEEEMLAQMKNS